MEVIFSSAPLPALPGEAFGINVNFCKNPHCPNFGVPAEIVKHRHKKGALAATPGTAYGLVTSHSRLALKCLLCKEQFAVKSNLAVAEELARFNAYLSPAPAICCRSLDCANKTDSVEVAVAYYHFDQPGPA